MIILRDNIKIVKIEVEGYAYPFAKDFDDSNWLSLLIESERESLNFKKNDTCITTYELEDLKQWFLKIQNKEIIKDNMKFIEPSISFEIENGDKLTIILMYGLNPNYEIDYESKYLLSFLLSDKMLKGIIDGLNGYIRKFPIKGNYSTHERQLDKDKPLSLSKKEISIYKTHKDKEYTKEEWNKYLEEQRKNRPPGTTWSLLDDND